jgi:hypothetical protein
LSGHWWEKPDAENDYVRNGKNQIIGRKTRSVFEKQWEMSERPSQGWVWSAPTKTGHFEKSTLKKQHQRAIRASRVRLPAWQL